MKCCPMNSDKIVIGYYPLRGKAQVCRLLCEFLHLPYEDLFFTPQCWESFKNSEITRKWIFAQLPFLKENAFVVTETYPMSLYLVNKANRKDLLGKPFQDETKVDMFLCQCQITTELLAFFVATKQSPQENQKKGLQKFWQTNISPKLNEYEKNCCQNFYLGYITLIDFYFYEIIILLRSVFKEKVNVYPKLNLIYESVLNIPEIKAYEESQRAVKNLCPVQFCSQWKEKCCG